MVFIVILLSRKAILKWCKVKLGRQECKSMKSVYINHLSSKSTRELSYFLSSSPFFFGGGVNRENNMFVLQNSEHNICTCIAPNNRSVIFFFKQCIIHNLLKNVKMQEFFLL